MYQIKPSIATFIVVLVVVACGGLPDVETPASIGTTVTIPTDSEWQVPSGFNVVIPLTYKQVVEMLKNDLGSPPNLPEFTMSGEVATDGEPERVGIVVFSDGVSDGARPSEVLTSWFESFSGADFAEPVVLNRSGLQIAASRGHAQGPAQSSRQGAILIIIAEPETRRVWRVMCLVSSEVLSDEVARFCERISDEFRPIESSLISP